MSAVRILEVPVKPEENTQEAAHEEIKDMAPSSSQFSKVPNYFWGLLITILTLFIASVAQNFYWKGQIDAKIETINKLEDRITSLENYNQKSREQFAANGWSLDKDGNLSRIRK